MGQDLKSSHWRCRDKSPSEGEGNVYTSNLFKILKRMTENSVLSWKDTGGEGLPAKSNNITKFCSVLKLVQKKICNKEGFGQKTVLERNCPDSSFEAVTLIRSSGLPVQHKEAKSTSSYCPGSGSLVSGTSVTWQKSQIQCQQQWLEAVFGVLSKSPESRNALPESQHEAKFFEL